jgi:hypothetical protein
MLMILFAANFMAAEVPALPHHASAKRSIFLVEVVSTKEGVKCLSVVDILELGSRVHLAQIPLIPLYEGSDVKSRSIAFLFDDVPTEKGNNESLDISKIDMPSFEFYPLDELGMAKVPFSRTKKSWEEIKLFFKKELSKDDFKKK